MPNFMGYQRSNGTVGIRNYVLIMATMECSWEPAKRIAGLVEGSIVVGHAFGCRREENGQVINTLIGIGQNPNIAAVLVVGLGCEDLTADVLVGGIIKSNKPVRVGLTSNLTKSFSAIVT